jgi:hypothetical protein
MHRDRFGNTIIIADPLVSCRPPAPVVSAAAGSDLQYLREQAKESISHGVNSFCCFTMVPSFTNLNILKHRADDIKEMMLRALESPERAHTLLIGPPACAKPMFIIFHM